jgi:hypothetical protein
MVRCDLVDAFADRVLSTDTEPEMTVTVTNPAAALESEIERVRRSERSAFEADDMDKVLELRAERQALQVELETTERERLEVVPVLDPATGEARTVGQTWTDLDPAERRPWLRRRGIYVELTKDGARIVTPIKEGKLSALGRMAAEMAAEAREGDAGV